MCRLRPRTGLARLGGASEGTPPQVNRQVAAASVAYRREESARLAQDMPAKAITLTKDETFTGGLCLVATEPMSNYIVLEQAAHARDHDTWQRLMEQALAGLNCQGIPSTSDAAPGRLASVEQHLGGLTRRTSFRCSMNWAKLSQAHGPPSSEPPGRLPRRFKPGWSRGKNGSSLPVMPLPSVGRVGPPKPPQVWNTSPSKRRRRAESPNAPAGSESRSPRACALSVMPITLSIESAACVATASSLRVISKPRLTRSVPWHSRETSARHA